MNNEIDLDELERLASNATQGVWQGQAVVGYRGDLFEVRVNHSRQVAGSIPNAADASYIAAANPTAILSLVRELKVARGKQPTTAKLSEREAFEACMRKDGWDGWSLSRSELTGLYNDGGVERFWKVWQARAEIATPSPQDAPQPEPVCGCRKCSSPMRLATTFIVCPTCGNKRCPKASDHELACTSSNEPGQPGSVYAAPISQETK